MKFCANNKTCVNVNMGDDETIEVETSKCIGLQIDRYLTLENTYSIHYASYDQHALLWGQLHQS
jgi:hypothetical protein